MGLIIRLFFAVISIFFLVTIVAAFSLVFKVRQHLQNPFMKEGSRPSPPPPGKGEIIEGEFKVLDEKQK